MGGTFNIFSITLLISGSVTVFMALLILQRLGGAVRWFGFLMLAIAIWALSYGFELSTNTLAQMLFWINLEYIGVALLPALWIVFIIKFIGKEQWLIPANLCLIFSIAVLTLLFVWTNAWHHLHYARVTADTSGPFPLLAIEPGPWYKVHTVYFYTLLAWGIYLLISKFRKADAIYRKQNSTILIGAFIPWFVNLIYLLDIRPFEHIDLTPYAFIITALAIGFGLLKFKLFDIVPVAREKVIEAMQEGVLVLDTQDRVIDVNTEMKKILSPHTSEIIGMHVVDLLPNEKNLHQIITERGNNKVIIQLSGETSHWFFEVNTTSLFDKHTVYSGIILLFRDITEQKLAEEKLKEQAEQLRSLNQLKDRLFSIIGHDLRSPLVSLMDMLKLADEEDISEEEFKSFLPMLANNVGHTSELLENLLHWAKSQLQGETIHPVHFDLKTMVDQKMNLFGKKASDKGIHIDNKVQGNTNIYADQHMIDLVLRNLLANAIKFCKKDNTITITAAADDELTTVCVSDTGVGIPEQNLTKLFASETFTTQGTGSEKGTGLGLLLCKDFVEKNHGKIWVESTPGKGSKFYFTVPNGSLNALPALVKDDENV